VLNYHKSEHIKNRLVDRIECGARDIKDLSPQKYWAITGVINTLICTAAEDIQFD
jgi:hypothetical protein